MNWWGYHVTKGWVFLDRNLDCNRPMGREKKRFVICETRVVFESYSWKEPEFLVKNRYLESLCEKERGKQAALIAQYEKDIHALKETVRCFEPKIIIGNEIYKEQPIQTVSTAPLPSVNRPTKHAFFYDVLMYLFLKWPVIVIGLMFLIWIFTNSCYDTYEDAWIACNDKYNGRCSYLGPDYRVCEGR